MHNKHLTKFFLVVLTILISGCSTMGLSWKKTKQAAYNAATDPLTWAPALGTAVLYSTRYDQDISDYMMEHQPIQCVRMTSDDTECSERTDIYRFLNSTITLTTAALVDDDGNVTKKIKRLVVEQGAYMVSKSIIPLLEDAGKVSPDGKSTESLGSHHAFETFAGAAMTRRNVAQMDIPQWGKYTIVGFNYYFSSYSAFLRLQEGGHSLGDQFANIAMGNFAGLFMHDMFMLEDNMQLNIIPTDDGVKVSLNYRF